MNSNSEISNDLKILQIDESEPLTIKLATSKYKKIAKEVHPDKIGGGPSNNFQELSNAYKRVIEYIEKVSNESSEVNYEKDFFMKHNFMKECSTSFVIYVQEDFAEKWKEVLLKNLIIHRIDAGRLILKHGSITVTLYVKPKVDQRSKLHVQGKDQQTNLSFIMDNLSVYYKEVCNLGRNNISAKSIMQTQKCICPKCGKVLTNKKGVKTHILRMHLNKNKKVMEESVINPSVIESSEVQVSEPSAIVSFKPMTLTSIVNTNNLTEVTSPKNKKARRDSSSIDNEEIEFISEMVNEIVEECNDEQGAEKRITCGECGYRSNTQVEVQIHMRQEHEETESEKSDMCSKMEEQNMKIIELSESLEMARIKINNLTIKNEALVNEGKTDKLALSESIYELQETKNRLSNVTESLNAAIKQNSLLSDELATKDKLIEIMKDETND